jgi:pSer/pThr/pTyr-binding forkhead associated (FHA) protein
VIQPAPTNGKPASKPRRRKKTQEIEVPIAADAEPDTTATVRFRRPTDDAVQVLPGRLEVLAGEPFHKEIRFVRHPGEHAEVILGRDFDGSPGHVELQSKTVSRRHARLAFANGQWRVANLSQTNPVVVNDEALAAGNGDRPLADGDCLELGEVVLRFHAR